MCELRNGHEKTFKDSRLELTNKQWKKLKVASFSSLEGARTSGIILSVYDRGEWTKSCNLFRISI